MKAATIGMLAATLLSALVGASAGFAQEPPPQVQSSEQFTPEQLDQMLAPIALYPDSLIGQILMAATYPLEVVEADRWLQGPNNAALEGDQLTAALELQNWDPSVKSLVPFPQILRMMDDNLEWTERLGEAFLADQSAVMGSVQRLRQRAQAAGRLQSTPQEAIGTEGQAITIEPPTAEVVYVPVYDPAVVYGAWPYPDYPPYFFPGIFDGVVIDGRGFGWLRCGIVAPFWGWHHWDWDRRRMDIDRDRWARLNQGRPPVLGVDGGWEHDPSHRHGTPYRDPVVRWHFPGEGGSAGGRRDVRVYPTPPAPQPRPSFAGMRPQTPPPSNVTARGPQVQAPAERGQAGRASVPVSHPPAPHVAQPAPSAAVGGYR